MFKPLLESIRNLSLRLSRHSRVMSIVNKHVGDYPTATDFNYFWSFGSLSGLCLVLQIVTGVILAMHYVANADLAFASVEHIMRDVKGGWFFRYAHANGASFFFIVVYAHIARSLFFRSYNANKFAWFTGVIMFFLLILTAFIGYVLPWGQMSFWGATVITNLCSAIPVIGEDLVYWLWGGFSVSNATLNRFFSLHYILPMLVVGLVFVHLFFLHNQGSSSPSALNHYDKIPFYPYFFLKDAFSFCIFLLIYVAFILYWPNTLGHPDNYIEANPLATPAHIVPEWYFLPFYAILRAVPNKLGGVLLMGASIFILLVLPAADSPRPAGSKTVPLAQFYFSIFMLSVLLLGWLGGMPAEEPYIAISRIATVTYFSYFLLLIPTLRLTEDDVKDIGEEPDWSY